MKILAIDYGMKRIGFAVGSMLLRTGTPIDPVQRKNIKEDIKYIRALMDEYDAGKIVIGYPLNMDGTPGKITEQVENFAKHLRNKLQVEVLMVDERLTSFEAEELLKEHHKDYKKRKKMLDSVSALVILRSYMDSV